MLIYQRTSCSGKCFILAIAIIILSCGRLNAQQTHIPGPAGSGFFGNTLRVLANGNYVVSDQGYDEGAVSNVGAVYLYNGNTHALISTLKGSTAGDAISNSNLLVLASGNFLVISATWDNGAVVNAGAVTWVNGTTGLNGTVSSSNSLVGSSTNDNVGIVTLLSNGHYVVRSTSWDNGAIINVGAVTWGNGITGTSGVISSSNSLIGAVANDNIGASISLLTNGNYVVVSNGFDFGGYANVGAATWCNGTIATSAVVNSSNSLIGSATDDFSGTGFLALTNGNYVVRTGNWDNGAIVNAGAVTWANGTTGISGTISSSNALVGTSTNDQVGSALFTELTNGNYVVKSPSWRNGTATSAGAVTWCNGSTGRTGIVSAANSLVGSTINDQVGITLALSNGNYVVFSQLWDNGAIQNVGAVTWGNGSIGITGTVSSLNSLVGSLDNDRVGNITALTNGNYVVLSMNWDNGAILDAGAVTWGNGTIPITGTINSSNSLVGTTAGDLIGWGVMALSNGNYVTYANNWDNGAVSNVGCATWADGTTGITGTVTSLNSLVGTNTNDYVGANGVKSLSNGNYVVSSPNWNNGVLTNAGAATWGNGTTGITGAVSSSNSLVGSSASDYISNAGIFEPGYGNYVVSSTAWHNGAVVDAGASTWANGSAGVTGVISSVNSLVGSTASDHVGVMGLLNNGNYLLFAQNWDNGAVVDAGALTWVSGASGITGTVSSSNSITGAATNDFAGSGGLRFLTVGRYGFLSPEWNGGLGAMTWGNGTSSGIGIIGSCNSVLGTLAGQGNSMSVLYNPVYDYMIVGRYAENIVSIFRPSTTAMANHLDEMNTVINGSSAVPLIANAGCRLIATITPNGASPVSGTVNARVWIESTVPTYASQPFVARHYEITPAANAATATGNVTLYFTQQEFDDFNNDPLSGLNLPTGSADAIGKANLRIGKYAGSSGDGSGLPGTYSGGAMVVNPADADIVWNSTLNRWEVSFNCTGFSGFIVQTHSFVLPLTLLEFNGRLVNNNAVVNWKTTNEQGIASFDLERSTDGNNYSAIANKPALNGSATNHYSHVDADVRALGVKVIYYRLKQIAQDGRFTYSPIVPLTMDNNVHVMIYPNPVADKATVVITVDKGQQLYARIMDNTGRIIRELQWSVVAGSNSFTIDVSNLSKGSYYIDLKGATVNERKQFVKQ